MTATAGVSAAQVLPVLMRGHVLGKGMVPVSTGSMGGACSCPALPRRANGPGSRAAHTDARGSDSDDGFGASSATDATLASIEDNGRGLSQDAEKVQRRARYVQQLLATLQNDLDAEGAATL